MQRLALNMLNKCLCSLETAYRAVNSSLQKYYEILNEFQDLNNGKCIRDLVVAITGVTGYIH